MHYGIDDNKGCPEGAVSEKQQWLLILTISSTRPWDEPLNLEQKAITPWISKGNTNQVKKKREQQIKKAFINVSVKNFNFPGSLREILH